ncbi:hypothetical protein T10_6504 [Trichinella papuae]|uniref:Uncharacterized protein n=1 Tax=Trichinella papuae TaxID=268474 RepID=A0A0V1MER7_9BILA|nr:hypothetical protein T10_6504 [Trichinella papuae]
MKDHLERAFFKAPGIVDCEGGLKASYSISFNIAKKALSYSIGEEIIIPAIKEFLFANYLKGDAKGETIFRCLEDYLKEHNVPLRNITAVATSSARAVTEDL